MEYHRPRPSVAEEFKRTQENPKKTVAGQFNKEMVEQATPNRVITHYTRHPLSWEAVSGHCLLYTSDAADE